MLEENVDAELRFHGEHSPQTLDSFHLVQTLPVPAGSSPPTWFLLFRALQSITDRVSEGPPGDATPQNIGRSGVT